MLMSVFGFKRSDRSASRPDTPCTYGTQIEPLEARIVMAVNTWISAVSGDWGTSSNWSDGTPTADDDVIINPAGALVITVSGGAQIAASISAAADDTLQITGGSLTVSNASTIAQLAVGGGSLAANGELSLTGASTHAGGTVSGLVKITPTGTYAWSVGDFGAGTITNEGAITISSAATKRLVNTVLNNGGTVTETGTALELQGGIINNQAGALWDIQSDGAAITEFGTVGAFNNSGTLKKSAGVGSSNLGSVNFNNQSATAAVTVETGTLGLSGGGTSVGGTFSVSLGAELNLNGASETPTLTGTYIGTGAGKIALSGGSVAIGAAGAHFNFTNGLFEWSGGNVSGTNTTLTNDAFLQITTATTKRLIGTTLSFVNSGTVTQTGTNLELQGTNINNLAGATWDIQSDGAAITEFGSVGAFNNSGTLKKTAGAGSSTLGNVDFNNAPTGAVTVQTGTLNLSGGGTSVGGVFVVSAGAELNLNGSGQTPTFTGTYTGTGAGKVSLTGGGLAIGSAGAIFDFSAGLFEWSGGDISGTNATLRNDGFVQITSANTKRLLGTTLVFQNTDTVIETGSQLELQGATIQNDAGGVWDIRSDGTAIKEFGSVGAFNNSGTLKKSAGALTSSLGGVAFNNAALGNVVVETGVLALSGGGNSLGGVFTVSAGAELDLNGSSETPTLTGTYTGTGAGRVALNGGQVTIGPGGATFDFASGLFEWRGGNITGTNTSLTNTGSVQLTTATVKRLIGTTFSFENSGTVTETGINLELQGAQINNLAGATWDIQSDGLALTEFGAVGAFNNFGTLKKSAGAGTSTFGAVDFNNAPAGIVAVQLGTLALSGGGTSTGGTFNVTEGAVLDVNGSSSSPAWTGVYTGSGAGKVALSGGGLVIGAAGATFNFPVGMFDWSAGDISDLNGGPLTNLGFLQVTSATTKRLVGATLVNVGTVVESGSDLELQGSALDNRPGGIWDIQGSGTAIKEFGAVGAFYNAGTLRKSVDAGASNLHNVDFNNAAEGIVEVKAGVLNLSGGGTSTGGTFSVDAGAELNLNGANQTPTLTGTFTGAGAGIVTLSGGQIAIGAAGATFGFPAGFFQWSGGDFSGQKLMNTGFLQITSATTKRLLGASSVLENSGTVIESGSNIELQGATISNLAGGLWSVTGPGNAVTEFGANGFFNNAGTFRSNVAGTATLAGVDFSNTGLVEVVSGTLSFTGPVAQVVSGALNAGTWDVQTASTLQLNAGPLSTIGSGATVIVRGSSGFSGIGSMTTNNGSLSILEGATFGTLGSLTNNGSLTLGVASVLNVNGGFTQGATGRVEFLIGGNPASNNFGRITATGVAAVDGVARFTLANGFGPSTGEVFPLLTAGSITGFFDAFEGLGLQRTPLFDAVLNATSLVLTSIANAADLDVSGTSGNASATSGDSVTINFTVTNVSAETTFSSSWTDSVYLSLDDKLDASDKLIGRTPHTGALGPGASYSSSVTGALPGAIPGQYRFLVVADSAGQMPDRDRTNNTDGTATVTTDVTALTPGVNFTGTIASGQDRFFRIDLLAGQTPRFTTQFDVPGQAELYLRQRDVPSRALFDEARFSAVGTSAEITEFSSTAGTYYLLLHGRSGAGAGEDFTLRAEGLPFGVASLSLTSGAPLGNVTTIVRGSLFTPETEFSLVPNSGPEIPALETIFIDSATAWVTFNLNGLGLGSYGVEAEDGAASATLANGFNVTNGVAGRFTYDLSTPRFIRPPFRGTSVTINYANVGNTDVIAPVLTLTGTNAKMHLLGEDGFTTGSIEMLAVNKDGPAGVLPPGARGTLVVEFEPEVVGPHFLSNFRARIAGPSNLPIDWELMQADFQPRGLPNDAWDAIYENFKTQIGTTYAQYQATLADNATYLSSLGIRTADVGTLLGFELEQAGGFGALAERYQTGPLGRGQTAPFDLQAITSADGNVRIEIGDEVRSFIRQADGSFLGVPGETGRLVRENSGAFTLTELQGDVTHFRALDGRADSVHDSQGSGVVAAYDGSGKVTTLTETDGDVTTFSYNAQNRISQITDSVGRVTSFTYDAAGRMITRTNSLGTITYDYVTGAGAAREHAIESITYPDGTHVFYSYDAQGRMISQERDGGTERVEFTYDSAGGMTSTDLAGNTTTISRVGGGHFGRVVDALGRVTTASFDGIGNVMGVVDPMGATLGANYGSNGRFSGIDDPLGRSVELKYSGALNRLESLTDPNGNRTRFGFDSEGNLTSLTDATGGTTRYSYDALGNRTQWINERGQLIGYTYDSHGLVTFKDLPGTADDVTYTYDSHRNLKTAADAGGTTSFEYDAADRMTKVTFPNGRFITYTFNANGQRTEMADQDGFTVRYSYDAAGRLDAVRDVGNAVITDYTYDSLGRLTSELHGNSTSTDYDYDALNRITSITHRAPNTSVTESFTYTYDAGGRIAAQTSSVSGATSYTYDLAGQLTSVTLPGRVITYAYDGNGNRTVVNDTAGGSTSYTTDTLNQYTTAGGAAFRYDPDGNLVSRNAAGVPTAYTYDAEGRLIAAITPEGSFTYDYDAAGYRIGSTKNGVRTDLLVDPSGLGNVFAEYGSGGALVAHYAQGLGLTSRIEAGGQAEFYHYDLTGNTQLLTGTGGMVLATYNYLPFGEKIAVTGNEVNPFTFNGKFGIQENGAGLYDMRARTYDPTLGRFVQADPLNYTAGDTNLYRFAINDPISHNDPSGKLIPTVPTGFLTVPLENLGAAAAAQLGLGGLNTATTVGAANLSSATAFEALFGLSGQGATFSAPVNAAANAFFTSAPNGLFPGAVGVTTPTATVTGEVAALGTGGLGLLGGGLVAAGVGWGVGSAIDQVTEVTNPDAKQGFRDTLAEQFNLNPNPDQPLTDRSGLNHGGYNNFIRNNLDDPLINAVARRLIENGTPPAEAVEEARRLVNNHRNDPNNPDNTRDGTSETITPNDPNNILGPNGVGADPLLDVGVQPVRFDGFVKPDGSYGYTILFENKASAGAPAQNVTVTQTLDSDLDLSTFELGAFGFGDIKVEVPEGRSSFSTRVDASATLGVLVDVTAELDFTTREVKWTFTSLDPVSGDFPLDPFAGFLPPNVTLPEGDGFVTYNVKPLSNVASGTRIDALATIVFDTEAPIDTPAVHNIIDSAAPSSAITAFAGPMTSRPNFTVRFTGADGVAGSGIATFNLFYRDNGGALLPLAADVPSNSPGVRFTGEVGHTYQFFSTATDRVGNTELLNPVADATIQVVAPVSVAIGNARTFVDSDGDIYTVRRTGRGAVSVVLLDPDGDGRGPIDQLIASRTNALTTISVTVRQAAGGDGLVSIGDVTGTGSLKAFVAAQSDLVVNGFTYSGAVTRLIVHDILQPDPVLTAPLIQVGGGPRNPFSLFASHIADNTTVTTTSTLNIQSLDFGEGTVQAAAIGRIRTLAGNFDADVNATAVIAQIIVSGGDLTGTLTAPRFGGVSVVNGDFDADLTSTASAAALRRVAAIAAVTVSGGDFTGDVRASGAAGPLTVVANSLGAGGNMTGATFSAASIARITIGKNLTGSTILAGANLGADHALGGTGANADTFGPGRIGIVGVWGSVSASVIGAGLVTTDAIFKNGDDDIPSGVASSIANLTIDGTASADSYFAAGAFTAGRLRLQPRIGGAFVNPATDPRFLV